MSNISLNELLIICGHLGILSKTIVLALGPPTTELLYNILIAMTTHISST